jgi:hypothetical protein
VGAPLPKALPYAHECMLLLIRSDFVGSTCDISVVFCFVKKWASLCRLV